GTTPARLVCRLAAGCTAIRPADPEHLLTLLGRPGTYRAAPPSAVRQDGRYVRSIQLGNVIQRPRGHTVVAGELRPAGALRPVCRAGRGLLSVREPCRAGFHPRTGAQP